MSTDGAGTTTGDRAIRPDRFWQRLATVAGLAAGVRLLAIFAVDRLGIYEGLGGDGARYHLAARALANGDGYLNPFWSGHPPDALQPPLWTTVLGLIDLVGARTPVQQALAASLIGVVTVVLLGVAGRELVSPTTGLVAALIGAVYPGLWTYERNLNAETLVFPLVTATVILAYRYRARPRTGTLLWLATLIALLALTRAEQLLLVPLVLLPLVVGDRTAGWPRKVGLLAASGALIIGLIAPWTIYNLDRFEHPVVLSAGAGNAMIVSSCDGGFRGDLMGSYDVACYFDAADRVDTDDRTVQDAAFRTIALDYTRDHLGELPLVVLAREGRSWTFFEPAQQALIHGEQLAIDSRLVQLQILLYWVLLGAAVAGTIALRRSKVALYPLLSFPTIVVISTAVTFGDIRYRAPAEIPIILLAAVAISTWLRRRRSVPDPAPGIGAEPRPGMAE